MNLTVSADLTLLVLLRTHCQAAPSENQEILGSSLTCGQVAGSSLNYSVQLLTLSAHAREGYSIAFSVCLSVRITSGNLCLLSP